MKKPSAEGGSEGCAQAAVTGRGRETQSQWAEERAGKHIVTKADKVACTASQFRGGGERKAPKRPCHCWSGRPGGWEGEELGVGRVEFESPWMGEKLDVWIWGSEMFVLEVVAVRRRDSRGTVEEPSEGQVGRREQCRTLGSVTTCNSQGPWKGSDWEEHRHLSPWPGEGPSGWRVAGGEHGRRKQEAWDSWLG